LNICRSYYCSARQHLSVDQIFSRARQLFAVQLYHSVFDAMLIVGLHGFFQGNINVCKRNDESEQ